MIQRIQSLYLLMAAALMSVSLLAPLAKLFGSGHMMRLMAFGFQDVAADGTVNPVYVVSTSHLGILLSVCTAIALIIIFLYKKRTLQIRLCYVELVLLLGAQIMIGYHVWKASSSVRMLADGVAAYSVADIMPFVAAIFTFLAMKAIIRDEALVRSLDRIR